MMRCDVIWCDATVTHITEELYSRLVTSRRAGEINHFGRNSYTSCQLHLQSQRACRQLLLSLSGDMTGFARLYCVSHVRSNTKHYDMESLDQLIEFLKYSLYWEADSSLAAQEKLPFHAVQRFTVVFRVSRHWIWSRASWIHARSEDPTSAAVNVTVLWGVTHIGLTGRHHILLG
jgi:hypothetical protein